jgi:hypothetical protein
MPKILANANNRREKCIRDIQRIEENIYEIHIKKRSTTDRKEIGRMKQEIQQLRDLISIHNEIYERLREE